MCRPMGSGARGGNREVRLPPVVNAHLEGADRPVEPDDFAGRVEGGVASAVYEHGHLGGRLAPRPAQVQPDLGRRPLG